MYKLTRQEIEASNGSNLEDIDSKISLLHKTIFKDNSLKDEVSRGMMRSYQKDFFVVFFSVCDGESRALVYCGRGTTIQNAWDLALDQMKEELLKKQNYKPIWLKVDFVDQIQTIKTADLNYRLREHSFAYFYRKGLAFDENFETAFLEAELNGNNMLVYKTGKDSKKKDSGFGSLDQRNINDYLRQYDKRPSLKAVPKKIFEFNTRAFFCDEQNIVYPLYRGHPDAGRRIIPETTGEVIQEIITKASRYLNNLITPSGKFIYGYYPIFGREAKSYNIVRHVSSLWSLANLYRVTGDKEVLANLDLAIQYVIDNHIEYKDKETAFVVERKSNEIKLGANGMALVMFTEYMDVVKTDKYVQLVRHLANGAITMQNKRKGTFVHVLSFPSYELKDKFRVIYYDGEVVFGLARAYSVTKDEKYLLAAKAGVDNFIAKKYTKYRDHWVAYALNELTKHLPEPRYFKFAMKNVKDNLERIYQRGTSFHTYLELLMVSWQTYERLKESSIDLSYMEKFDVERFAQTIYRRARHMLNGFFYPEYAMYMKYPNQILDGFMVRHQSFRTRIDDVQHFIGGYYYYVIYYANIRKHLSEEFLHGIDDSSEL